MKKSQPQIEERNYENNNNNQFIHIQIVWITFVFIVNKTLLYFLFESNNNFEQFKLINAHNTLMGLI